MVTDKQYRDLLDRFEELERKYAQMSRDIATIRMKMDVSAARTYAEPEQSRKDVTRYWFDGQLYNKRRLVLVCIKRYIADTGTTDPVALSEIFPDCIQGSLGVIRSAGEAEQYSNATEHYFFKDEDVLYLDDGIYVVCKDWTVKNIRGFIDIMETLGYEIKTVNRY